MVSCSGSLLFRSCSGEGGALQCVGSTYRVPATLGLPPLTGVCACVCFPRLHCSGSRLLYMERAQHCVQFQFLGIPQKRELGCTCVLCFPARAAQAVRSLTEEGGGTLPGCGAPSPLRGPSLSFHACQSGACALCLAATLPADVDHPESQEVFG